MFDPLKLTPLGNRMIVEVLDKPQEEKTKSGIILVPSAKMKKKVLKCKIVKLSDYFKNGNLIEGAPYKPDVKEGDIVYVEQAYLNRIESTEYAHGNVYDILGKEYEEG